MKRLFAAFLMIIAVASLELAFTRSAHAAGVAGWTFQWWDCCGSSTTVVNSVNWNNVGTGSGYHNYLSGYVKWPGTDGTAKTIMFAAGYDDGHTLKANGVIVASGPCCGWAYGSVTANPGDIVKLEFTSDNYGGGPYSGYVMWDPQGDGTYELVTGTSIATTADYWAPVYTSKITAAQQARVNSAASRLAAIMQNGIYIDQVGANNQINVNQVGHYNQVSGIGATNAPVQGSLNNITIRQGDPANPVGKNLVEMSVQGTGSNTLNLNQGRNSVGNYTGADVGWHYQAVSVAGYGNQVTTSQQNTGGSIGHYLEANVVGNYNTVGIIQSDGTTQKQTFTSINGNNNNISASQTGVGNHYLDISLSGSGNSANVTQYGNIANAATIGITNAGGPASVNLTQTGGQVYNILTTCVTVGGCAAITVRQGN